MGKNVLWWERGWLSLLVNGESSQRGRETNRERERELSACCVKTDKATFSQVVHDDPIHRSR